MAEARKELGSKGPATRNDIVDDIVDDPSSTIHRRRWFLTLRR